METLTKKQLFWDVESVDAQKNGKFVIERILNFGDEDDFRWALKFYGKDKIAETVLTSRNLNKKSLAFWCGYFNLDEKQCLKNQLIEKQSLFSRR